MIHLFGTVIQALSFFNVPVRFRLPQGVREDTGAPFAILRCQETPATLAAWPHEFELFYEVSVGERDLSLSLLARNVGRERLSFTTSLQPHIGVTDATSTAVRMLARSNARAHAFAPWLCLLPSPPPRSKLAAVLTPNYSCVRLSPPGVQGLTGSPYFDNSTAITTGGKPRVRVEHEPAPSLPPQQGPTERLYINTQPRVALEVGTGCTVFVENTDGFTDHLVRADTRRIPYGHSTAAVPAAAAGELSLSRVCLGLRWAPWPEQHMSPSLFLRRQTQVYNPGEALPSFPNFVALGPAVVGRPVKLQPVRRDTEAKRSQQHQINWTVLSALILTARLALRLPCLRRRTRSGRGRARCSSGTLCCPTRL